MTGTRSNLIKRLTLVVFSLALALAVVELALRGAAAAGWFPRFFAQLGDPTPPMDRKSGAGLYYVHPYSSYAMKPGYRNPRVSTVWLPSAGRRRSASTRVIPTPTPSRWRRRCDATSAPTEFT